MAKANRDRRPTGETAGPEIESIDAPTGLTGKEAVKVALGNMPTLPGVYRMLAANGEVLYVGKARNLKNRVTAYLQPGRLDPRLHRMVNNTALVEIVTTTTEAEALLLEANLIKKLKPRYNVVLRDDKSFPYILLRTDHDWPQVTKHRGARRRAGDYFGPFASAGAVNRTVTDLQRAFPLRSCTDHVLSHRTRPCLQYQIKRCVAPCVGLSNQTEYARIVDEVRTFLRGRTRDVQESLAKRMQDAADELDFERAAAFRDRILALNHIQAHQEINAPSIEQADVVAMHQTGGQTCVQVFFIRHGRNYGNRAYFPSRTGDAEPSTVMAAFLGQFYENKIPPRLVLVSTVPEQKELLAEALASRTDHKILISKPQRGARRALMNHALDNARDALSRRLAESGEQRRLLKDLAERLNLEDTPQRIEVYDNSHIQGDQAVGAMIVVGPDGFVKNQYRKFTIKGEDFGSARGDDYAMMREVFHRRFSRLMRDTSRHDDNAWPDLVLIDGGKGQVTAARETLASIGLHDVMLAGVAKGVDRHAGNERIYIHEMPPITLDRRDSLLYFIQRVRDEAHRFAIGSHRKKREKQIGRSLLDRIPGIGSHRKKALLHHFGSVRAVADASLEDLEKVEGLSRKLARQVRDFLHDEG